MLLPFDDTMALILDDTNEVWPDCGNLVLAERFLFFQEVDELHKKFSGDNDCYLHFISDLLIKVHQKFYSENCADVKLILAGIRKSILCGTEIVLSGIISNEETAAQNHYWIIAERYGSIVTRDISDTTTHVLANSFGTKKTKIAAERDISVLHVLWLHLSTSFWCRLPEDYFRFENINNFEIKSILATSFVRRIAIHEEDNPQKRLKTHSSPSNSDKESESESESDAEAEADNADD